MHDDGSTPARFTPLGTATAAFHALTREPGPLQLDGIAIGQPGTYLGLDETQHLLLDPAVPCGLRDRLWRALTNKARSEDPAWVVGAAVVAAPRLRRITERLAGGRAADDGDIEAAVLSGFVDALATASIEHRHLEQRLLWAAHRAGAWRMYSPSQHSPDSQQLGVHFRAALPDATSITQILT